MRKLKSGICSMFLVIALTACGSAPSETPQESRQTVVTAKNENGLVQSAFPVQKETGASISNPGETGRALIAYFSRVGNTDFPEGVDAVSSASLMIKDGRLLGNTQYIAELIREQTGGDLFLIETVEKYPADYDETDAQGGRENRERPRPKLANHIENLEDYEIIYLGFPNWYYDMPMAVYSFLDEYDLSGKTIVPFSTSGGGGFSNTIRAIKEEEPEAQVITDGFTVTHSRAAGTTQEEIKNWLSGLGL